MLERKYRMLEAITTEELSELVTKHLAEGWDCWGNPFAVPQIGSGIKAGFDLIVFCQAVVLITCLPIKVHTTAGYTVGTPETNKEEPIIGCIVERSEPLGRMIL